jgi:2'-5' RNA ligase
MSVFLIKLEHGVLMAYRLFIAIELPDAVKDQLTRLRADLTGATWVKRNAYHLTLRFLGDGIEAPKLEAVKSALAHVQAESFTVTLQGVGRFPPNPNKAARVLWVGMSAPPALKALAGQIERAVTGLGFPSDAHDFHPHITLARLKSFKPDTKVDQFLLAHQRFRSESISVTEFHLFSSVLSPQGPTYHGEATYPLGSS